VDRIYICVYEFGGTRQKVIVRRPDMVTGGFWITETFERSLTKAEDKYWIPPGRIILLEALDG
jgi:hypothetical protein